MNFEIKRLRDVQLILRVFSLWIFIQVLRDIVTYAVLMHTNPSSIIYKVTEYTGYRLTIANIFLLCAICIVPYFFSVLCGWQSQLSKKFGRTAVGGLFIIFLTWLTIVPYASGVAEAGWYVRFVYSGNAIEALALAWAFAWNINQHMKYELDYGLLKKVPDEYHPLIV